MIKNILRKTKMLFKKKKEEKFVLHCSENSKGKVVDLEKVKEEKKLKTGGSIELNNYSKSNNNNVIYVKDNKCIECNSDLTQCRKSAKNRGHYYICCNECGCIMKVHENGKITNTKNILKELSEAYTLFKKAGKYPKEYSYTRAGERKPFRENHIVPDEYL